MKKFFWTWMALACCGLTFSERAEHSTSKSGGFAENPKNVILLLGDGMGLAQISAALYAQAGSPFSLEDFPVVGFQKTHSFDNLITDSAASATAMACGKKTFNNAIGMDADTLPCRTILEEAEERGLATGLVVTSSIVHATPAAFIAHQPSRNLHEDIAADFLKTEVDLLIGGGLQYFQRRKNDERNLTDELRKKGYAVKDFLSTEFTQAAPDGSRNFVYFTADNQPLPASQGRDYLPLAAKRAVEFLQKRSEKGFFLMIEGSQIDWSCHANEGGYLLDEMKDFDETIKKVLRFAALNRETLVIVTADHETGGVALNPESKMKKPVIAFTTNGHTCAMVPVFAYGPKSELFRGIYDNTAIYHKMREALGFQ